ncbi:CapA family protein [Chryseolinea lacunae]|uniref:CapA family protein n=1 Tax=Chryseolinea lacunae TaxID=2801331 RepID=A0ABS1KJR5_9BACT|nr:CapA family protein [Chryseolinea lacunae]MBL0739698.1 CapA family protein [Chryseolinea lacunae]
MQTHTSNFQCRLTQIAVMLLFITTLAAQAQDTTRLSLLFAGDVMGHGTQIAAAYEPATKSYDYTSCFQYVKPYIEGADLSIANLEVTLGGSPYTGYPQFSSPDALARTLKEIGFDALVTANNHCVDRGKKGLERTVMMLDSFNIPHTGTFVDTVTRLNDSPLILQKNGFTLALLNYTYGTNGIAVPKSNVVNLLDTAIMHRDLAKAKELHPDVIIVFTHWGIEYQSLPNKVQKDLTEFCFKHGAQLVIGAHPHVIQPMEWRKDKNQFVAYSLGNFVSGQRKRYTDGGAMAYLELKKIQYKPDSAITTIDSAAYALQWVHRTVDAQKDYYVIPVLADEAKALEAVKGEVSKAAYRTFVSDSKLLYNKHNKDVPPLKGLPRHYAELPPPAEETVPPKP